VSRLLSFIERASLTRHGAVASLVSVHFQISCADGDVLEKLISFDLKFLAI
jgi:hypothetical protein